MKWWGKSDQKVLVLKLSKHRTLVYAMGMLLLIISTADAFADSGRTLNFRCPNAYQGIKSDMLPTYWEPTDKGRILHPSQSFVQGRYLICIYRKPSGKLIGNVRRLIPEGYQCITGGKGGFRCRSNLLHRRR